MIVPAGKTRPNVRTAVDILHITPYMHPRGGGPPVVVDRLCHGMTERGWTARVATTNTFADDGDVEWSDRYSGKYELEIHASRGPGSYSHSRTLATAIDDLVRKSRLVHLHTLWTFPTWAAIRACRRCDVPYVVMPHGMLDPHSLQRKQFKKRLYGRFIEWPNLRRALGMIYTTAEEQSLAESAVRGLPPGNVVSLGADEPPQAPRVKLADEFLMDYPELRGKTLVIFLGRLHPKKGLDLLIPAFALVAKQQPDAQLVLVGPGEPNYLKQLCQLSARLGVADRITYTGALEGRAKWAAFAAARLFALPSYQENFALVVVEALRMGVPVVISRRINIWEEIVRSAGGRICELTVEGVADAILPWVREAAAAEAAGRLGQEFVSQHFTWEQSVEALCLIYGRILGAPSNCSL